MKNPKKTPKKSESIVAVRKVSIPLKGRPKQASLRVRHGLGTRDVWVSLRNTKTQNVCCLAGAVAVTEDEVILHFILPPSSGLFVAIVIG